VSETLYGIKDFWASSEISEGSISNFVMTEWTPEGQADQTPKSLGLRIIRSLRETFVVNEMRLLLFLERLGSFFKRCRPKSFSAGPPAPLDLAFPWISITEKEMLKSQKLTLDTLEGVVI
jgi:hypothetical protein